MAAVLGFPVRFFALDAVDHRKPSSKISSFPADRHLSREIPTVNVVSSFPQFPMQNPVHEIHDLNITTIHSSVFTPFVFFLQSFLLRGAPPLPLVLCLLLNQRFDLGRPICKIETESEGRRGRTCRSTKWLRVRRQ